MFARCEQYSIDYLYIRVFRGWAMGCNWASSWSVWRVQNNDTDHLSGVCKTTTQTKGCIAFYLTLIALRCPAFNPTIDKLSDCSVLRFPVVLCLRPGFCFGQYIMFSFFLGITHDALVRCKVSVSQHRPARNDSDVQQQRLSWQI